MNLTRVILLDTDIYFNEDIVNLWNHFDSFNDSQAFALVEEFTNWYTKYSNWPVAKDVYNSGVILLDLGKLRRDRWNLIWKSEFLKPILRLKQISLGDQDIFNLVIKNWPQMFYELPCSWNVQLNGGTYDLTKCIYDHPIKILHWNYPKKVIDFRKLQAPVLTVVENLKKLDLL